MRVGGVRSGSHTACRGPIPPARPAGLAPRRSGGCHRGSCLRRARPGGTEAVWGADRRALGGQPRGGAPIRAGTRTAPRRPFWESTQVSTPPSGRDKEFTLHLPIRDNSAGTVVINSLVPPTSGSTKPRRSPSCRGFVASGLHRRPSTRPPRQSGAPALHPNVIHEVSAPWFIHSGRTVNVPVRSIVSGTVAVRKKTPTHMATKAAEAMARSDES